MKNSGFRSGRGCDDALHVLRMVVEKSEEWGEELWAATLDVEKAFDKVHHAQLFDALIAADVGARIVHVLRKLYRDMSAYVQVSPGVETDHFRCSVASGRGIRCHLSCSTWS